MYCQDKITRRVPISRYALYTQRLKGIGNYPIAITGIINTYKYNRHFIDIVLANKYNICLLVRSKRSNFDEVKILKQDDNIPANILKEFMQNIVSILLTAEIR